jgi:hypothetical protein
MIQTHHSLAEENDNILMFQGCRRMMPAPFFIVGDFEAILKPKNVKLTKSTTEVQEHVPCGFSYLVRSSLPEFDNNNPVIYRGPDAAKVFCEKIEEEVAKIMKLVSNQRPMVMTDSDKKAFDDAQRCYACRKHLPILTRRWRTTATSQAGFVRPYIRHAISHGD